MITSHTTCSVPGAIVCTTGRELDFRHAGYLHKQFDELLEQGFRYFILDLSATEMLDSSCMGVLFGIQKRIAPEGGRVMLITPPRPIAAVMRLIRSERIFRTYPSVEAALADLPAPPSTSSRDTTVASFPEVVPCLPAIEPETRKAAPPDGVGAEAADLESVHVSPGQSDTVEHVSLKEPELAHRMAAVEDKFASPTPLDVERQTEDAAAEQQAVVTQPVNEDAGRDAVRPGDAPRDTAVPVAGSVSHTVVYAGSTLAADPQQGIQQGPSEQEIVEQTEQKPNAQQRALEDLLDLVRSYGLIQGYTLHPAQVDLYLFADGEPLRMDYAGAEQFCNGLKQSLPAF